MAPISRLLDRGAERAWFYTAVETRDSRGNYVKAKYVPEDPAGHRVTVAEDRQSKAELPGQIDFRVMRVHLRADAVKTSWDLVWLRGMWWEPANPEWDSVGVEAASHQELLLRESNQKTIPGVTPPV